MKIFSWDIDKASRRPIVSKYLTVGETYYIQDTAGGELFTMVGIAEDVGMQQADLWRSGATYITTLNKELRINGSWCYKRNKRVCFLANKEDEAWLKYCMTMKKYVSYEDFLKIRNNGGTLDPKESDLIKSDTVVVSLGHFEHKREKGELLRIRKGQKDPSCKFVTYKAANGEVARGSADSFRNAMKEEIQFYKEENKNGTNVKEIGRSFEENSKYKAGDRVVVRANINRGLQFGTHHYPEGVEFIKGETLTVKRVTKRGEYIMKERGIRLKEDLINHSATEYQSDVESRKNLEYFPEMGWCKEYDEDFLRFLNAKSESNILYQCGKKNKCGVAWKRYGRKFNAYPVVNRSDKPLYKLSELEGLFPRKSKTVAVDLEANGIFRNHDDFLWKLVDPTKGKKASIIAEFDERPFWSDEYGQYVTKEWLEEKKEEEKKMREAKERAQIMQYPVSEDDGIYIKDMLPKYMRLDTPAPVICGTGGTTDSITSFGMALQARGRQFRTRGEFAQQEPIIRKSKKKKRKLIIC